MKPKLIHAPVLPQLIIATLVFMILARFIIMVESRHYRREYLRRVIAFWIGLFIVVLTTTLRFLLSKFD